MRKTHTLVITLKAKLAYGVKVTLCFTLSKLHGTENPASPQITPKQVTTIASCPRTL